MGRGLKGQTKTPSSECRTCSPGAAAGRPDAPERAGSSRLACFPPLFIVALSLPTCRVTGEEPATASSVCGCVGLGWRSLGTTGWVVLVSQSGHSLEFTRALSRGLANPLALDRGVCSRRLLARPRGLPGAPGTYPIWDARQSGDGVVGGVGRPAFSVSQLRMAILVKRTK